MTHLVHAFPLLLAPGDRCSLEEFLSRWEQMPNLKFAELIDGMVYMPSPVSQPHGKCEGLIALVLSHYAARTPGSEYQPQTTWLMAGSAPQPDAALWWLPEHGGRAKIVNRMLAGAPELIVEIARSSRAYDLGPKLALYQTAGVSEYFAILIEEERTEWRVLVDGSYRITPPDSDGIYRSRVFPGLWMDDAAFWRGDREGLLAVLEQGLQSRTAK